MFNYKAAVTARVLVLAVFVSCHEVKDSRVLGDQSLLGEDWGEGLRVLTTYKPELCEHITKKDDVIHYHYVGRLSDGSIFGQSFDYNTPYIVALGHGRIIAGMDRGLVNMCLWERRKITIPPHLGYGERGVGQVIPPNSTLVFYTRLIKIERNGYSLGEDQNIEDLWFSGLDSYTENDWDRSIDMFEEAIRLFNIYENQTLNCLQLCQHEGTDLDLSSKDQEIMDKYAENDPFVQQFLLYVSRSSCLKSCKARNLPSKLHNPDPDIIKQFRKRIPFSYLHYSYYQSGDIYEGARACFTYHHYNPTDKLALESIAFYRKQLDLGETEFLSREPVIQQHQVEFFAGRRSYSKMHWLEAADHFEKALVLYTKALNSCYLLCEDAIKVNLSQPNVNNEKKALFEKYRFVPETIEYYELLLVIIREVLTCRVECHDRLAVAEGSLIPNYLCEHFNHLQYTYFKLGNLHKAAQAAATYIARNPSDAKMSHNIHYYTSSLKIPSEEFVPIQEYVDIQNKLETEKRLLHYAKYGEVKQRAGQRGDSKWKEIPPRHEEL